MKPYALIIDNYDDNAKYFAKSLQQSGWQVRQVSAGHQAQVQLAFTTPDLVILNTALSLLPIRALLRQLHAQERFKQTRLVLLSDDSPPPENYASQADLVLPHAIEQAKLTAALSTVMPVVISK